MIFPEHCKHVGHASTKPCDDRVYFLSRWLLRDTPGGHEVMEVTLDNTKKGMMRPVLSSQVLAQENEVYRYPEKVNLHNRTRLVELALDTGHRCTIFTGHDEHQTFVLDPALSGFLNDVEPAPAQPLIRYPGTRGRRPLRGPVRAVLPSYPGHH